MSVASSREKLDNSPVKTKDSPARQSGVAAGGTGFEPRLGGPAIFAAFAAAQLKEVSGFASQKRKGLVFKTGRGVKEGTRKDSYLNLGFGLLLSLSSPSPLSGSPFDFPSTFLLPVEASFVDFVFLFAFTTAFFLTCSSSSTSMKSESLFPVSSAVELSSSLTLFFFFFVFTFEGVSCFDRG